MLLLKMRHLLRAVLALAALLVSDPVSAQWMTVDFQDAAPPTMTWTPGAGGSRDLLALNSPGACAAGVEWNHTRVAPGGGNGGWNDRGYYELRWCDVDVTGTTNTTWSSGFTEAGRYFEPGGTQMAGQNNWPATTFFGRMRLYIDTPIIVDPGGDSSRQMKFFIWHGGNMAYDGDQRVIGFLENGSNCGQADATHVCFTLQRNINHNTDTATVALSLDTWHHLQWSWKHGVQGVSYVKIWLNSNAEASPTAQDLNLSGVPGNPGGTTEWLKANAGYDDQFFIGNVANQGTEFDQDFVVRIMDFQLDDAFDSNWKPAATFTDATLVPGTTTVKAIHITELRNRIDGVRVARGLAAYSWTEAPITAGTTVIKAQHITELRTALNEAYAAAKAAAPTYTDSSLAAGTVIKAVHISELRDAVVTLE